MARRVTRELSALREATGLTKIQWRNTVDAADDWVDSAMRGAPPATSFRAALPAAARSDMNNRQLRRLLSIVALDRDEQGVD